MRHGNKINHLGRTSSHRRALMKNMAMSLIYHKRIRTTLAKAKALRCYIEPILTKCKTDSMHARRVVFSYLQDKKSTHILFNDISVKIADRLGGYTRIIKLQQRSGDLAPMCYIELVDYNELYSKNKSAPRTRRSRRSASKSTDDPKTTQAKPKTDTTTQNTS